MVNISALMKILPVSGLEPQWVALIHGEASEKHNCLETITFLEPPAGRRIPYIEPGEVLEKLLRHHGFALEDAQMLRREAVVRMKGDVAEDLWVNFFDMYESESPECIPVSDFVAWLRTEHHQVNPKFDSQDFRVLASDILNFFEQVAEVVASTPMFSGQDNWNAPWSLLNLPELPPPKAMIEFMPGGPWVNFDSLDGQADNDQFIRWRDAIRPVALELEKALGEPVYYFADMDNDIDDDDVHRFLVLHWCCTYKPESAYVRYLLKISGARDLEELKAALIDPTSYTQPFKMNDSFWGMEAQSCRIDYLPRDKQKTVAVLFSTLEAREAAQSVLEQSIGAHVFIIAPKELVTDEWVKQATRYCREQTVCHLYADTLDKPFEILVFADELCVIADEKRPNSGFDLKLSCGAENWLQLALDLGIKAKYFDVDRGQLKNPETCLKKRGVPDRLAANKAQRAAFTLELKEIRLDNDFGSSGLWDESGEMLGYDMLDLPFPLVRRIAAWQRNYDYNEMPPNNDGEWRKRHNQERVEIAEALQAALGSEIVVKLRRQKEWIPVSRVTL